MLGLQRGWVCKLLKIKTADEVMRERAPDLCTRLKLSKTKKRGRPLKTFDGREISHEEFLRGLVQHQAIMDAS